MKNNQLLMEIKSVLMDMVSLLKSLDYDDYTKKHPLLSDSSIGEHTRHVIELLQQLLLGYNPGEVHYENRQRDIRIQDNIDYAMDCIANIISQMNRPNKSLRLGSMVLGEETFIESNYFRELLYNLEHCLHHQAIIKVGLILLEKADELGDNFGVAKATISYRKSCAQ
ncbi:MAG: DinB family protein [Bacteroidota bacterium]